jgi:hypothetical protein
MKVNELENRWAPAVVSCCSEMLVAEAGDSGNPEEWERPLLQAGNGSEYTTTDTI